MKKRSYTAASSVHSAATRRDSSRIADVGIAGTGSCLPDNVITNADLAALINKGDKGAEWATDKLGIVNRRFMTCLDREGKPASEADELDMAERAARCALVDAGVSPQEIDGLWLVSCTQQGHARHHFSKSAFELHKRLGLRTDAIPLEMDAGCGGAIHAMILGADMLAGRGMDTMLIVASNAPSRYYGDWESYVAADVWLSMYIFGDGAGAAVLRRSERVPSGSRILASYLGVDPNQPLMYYEPRGNRPQPLYVIDARAVAISFGIYAKRALDGL
jgi:3-oxoacyl-[acyl-carrier-protein] synthase III